MGEYVVELKNITKRFPGVIALKNMSIGIRPGEIHGLIGENGAGKSTLIKVLTGVHSPEEGEIFVDGERRTFRNPVQSREAGIACVYQELNIVKQLPVTDNVFMGRAVKKGILLDYPRMHREAEEALKSLGHPEIDVRMECGKLGVGQQQMVEIAKAVSLDAKLIIMDEPTSSLGKEEIAQLMEWLRIAPSAANRQEWKFVAVTDPDQLAKLRVACESRGPAMTAPLIFCICATEYQEMNDSGYNRGTIDCSIASTYLHLGTFALGLGSCWVGSFDPDMATEIVGCPEGTRVVTVVTAGYADEDPAPRSRKALEDVAVYDRF